MYRYNSRGDVERLYGSPSASVMDITSKDYDSPSDVYFDIYLEERDGEFRLSFDYDQHITFYRPYIVINNSWDSTVDTDRISGMPSAYQWSPITQSLVPKINGHTCILFTDDGDIVGIPSNDVEFVKNNPELMRKLDTKERIENYLQL